MNWLKAVWIRVFSAVRSAMAANFWPPYARTPLVIAWWRRGTFRNRRGPVCNFEAARRRRHGAGLSGTGHQTEARGGHQAHGAATATKRDGPPSLSLRGPAAAEIHRQSPVNPCKAEFLPANQHPPKPLLGAAFRYLRTCTWGT